MLLFAGRAIELDPGLSLDRERVNDEASLADGPESRQVVGRGWPLGASTCWPCCNIGPHHQDHILLSVVTAAVSASLLPHQSSEPMTHSAPLSSTPPTIPSFNFLKTGEPPHPLPPRLCLALLCGLLGLSLEKGDQPIELIKPGWAALPPLPDESVMGGCRRSWQVLPGGGDVERINGSAFLLKCYSPKFPSTTRPPMAATLYAGIS